MTTSTSSRPIKRSGSPVKALRASASSTSGTPVRSSSAVDERRRPGRWPEPWAKGNDVGLELEHAVDGAEVDGAAGVSSSGSVMYSGAIAAIVGRHDLGVAIVTSPAPDRSAPMAVRCAAPVFPSEPATTSTRPKSPLCESVARAGTISRMRSRVSSSRCGPSMSSSSGSGIPMSAITRSPACVSAGGNTSGIFGAASVTVIVASTAGPARPAVSAETPVGRSIATIGTPSPFMSATTVSRSPESGPRKPSAEDRVNEHVAVRELGEMQFPLLRRRDLYHRHADSPEHVEVGAGIAAHFGDAADQEHGGIDTALHQRARDHETVTAVVAAPADDADAARRQVVEGRPRSPRRPAGRRSPSARSTECRSPRSCGDRLRASVRC